MLIRDIGDMQVLDKLEKGPLTIAVKRSMYDSVEEILKKRMIVFSVEKITSEYVVLKAAFPEHLCRLHKEILLNSHKLANPDVIWYLFKTSRFISYSRVKDPFELAEFLNKMCSRGNRFLYLLPRHMFAKGYILCGGTTAQIRAVVYEDYTTHIGVKALRYIFYQVPLEIFVYAVQINNP